MVVSENVMGFNDIVVENFSIAAGHVYPEAYQRH